MDLFPLRVFLTVAVEKSFSRAAEKLLRTQPAVSLAVQRLEREVGEKLIDRSAKELLLTDAGRVVLDYARRFAGLEADLDNALAELRDNSAGRLTVGANESTTLYLLPQIEQYRRQYPKVKVQVRRSLSSKLPGQLGANARAGPGNHDHLLRHIDFAPYLYIIIASEKGYALSDYSWLPLTITGTPPKFIFCKLSRIELPSNLT